MSTSRRRFRWRYPILGVAILLGLLVVVAVLSFRMGGEARALKGALQRAAPDSWDRRIELGVGRIPVAMTRSVAGWFPLPPEARAGLGVLRWADVGVYRRRSDAASDDDVALLTQARRTLERRGWSSLVTVRDGHRTVALFVPRKETSPGALAVCGYVMDRNDLVLLSVRGRADALEPLIESLWKRGGGHFTSGAQDGSAGTAELAWFGGPGGGLFSGR